MSKITVNDKLAYDLYYTDTPNDMPVICIEGFIKYKFTNNYKKYYTFLRKEKLKKIQKCQKYL